MIRTKYLKKTIAVFLLLTTLSNVVAPTVSYALTSGPTAPEATSFEPVDTTDMVNTITGDFVYNMPLMEVPGPAGGYPLSLSYHAGIQPNVDASWVGLGWTLNPGAINRIVNGTPDDYNGFIGADRVFWEGGEYTQSNFGISVGISGVASVSAGLSFASDTYKGRGVGGYLGVSAGFGKGSPWSASFQVGVSPFGGGIQTSVGIGLGLGKTAANGGVTGHLGMSINSSGNFGLSGGVNWGKSIKNSKGHIGGSLLGASISTGGGGSNVGIAGVSASANNSRDGKISKNEDHWSIDIPVFIGVNASIGRDYVRYWMDEKQTLSNYGSLHFPSKPVLQTDLANSIHDSYHLQGVQSVSESKTPINYLEGSFADYDMYNVNAQGVGGYIRPYQYATSLYSQNIVNDNDNTKKVLGYFIPQQSTDVQFRFTNDFSNRVLNNPPDIQVNKPTSTYNGASNPAAGIRIGDFDFDIWLSRLNDTYTDQSQDVPLLFPLGDPKTGIEGYEMPGNKRRIPYVPGSKHIEFFENKDLADPSQIQSLAQRGFIECKASGYARYLSNPWRTGGYTDGIGAFSITNSSGVTYHFSLPAYSSKEYTNQNTKDQQSRISFNELANNGTYAYTWYLTAITGPDYVDRGPNGQPDYKLNSYDWGYWVELSYGKWTDEFPWRNPGEGFNKDTDSNFQSFSKGVKELYYLNSISTSTHTALFVKELRADGKSSTTMYDESVHTDDNHNVTWTDPGGYEVTDRAYYTYSRGGGRSSTNPLILNGTYKIAPRSTLKLKQILLFDNASLGSNSFLNLSSRYNDEFHFTGIQGVTLDVNYHYGQNVLDVYDAQSLNFPRNKALRQIDFNYDYSLTPNTPNSFDPSGNLYEGDPSNFIPNNAYAQTKLGKLTLKSISFKGKGGADMIPPTNFIYDYHDQMAYAGSVAAISSKNANLYLSTNNADLKRGDIVKLTQAGQTYYAFITQIQGSQLNVTFVSGSLPAAGSSFSSLTKTKNPPYNKDLVDMWGYYKMDFVDNPGDNLSRYPSIISAQNADVWSLREIESSLGATIKVDYEADTYGKNALENLTMQVTPATPISSFFCSYYQPPFQKLVPVYYQANSTNDNINLATRFAYLGAAQGALIADITSWGMTGPTTGPGTLTDATVLLSTSSNVQIQACAPVSTLFSSNGSAVAKGGTLIVPSAGFTYGGGIRVKKISIVNSARNEIQATNYTYDFSGRSSGVTSYEPVTAFIEKTGNSSYKSLAIKPLISVLALARDIPAPGIYYGKVRVSETIQTGQISSDIPGYSEFEFQTFDPGMIGIDKDNVSSFLYSGTHSGQSYSKISTRKITLRDFTSRLGALKAVTLYDQAGHMISKTENQYLEDQQTDKSFASNGSQYPALIGTPDFKSQGVIHEVFNHARWINNGAGNELDGLISKREVYPSVQTGTKTTNFKTGIVTETKNLAFDFYSGQVTKTQSTDGYGNTFVTESTPAYLIYPSMGLKAPYGDGENFTNNSHLSNRHMLEQVAASKTYKAGYGLLSATAQTWSNDVEVLNAGAAGGVGIQPAIWRMRSSYQFIGDENQALNTDGTYPMGAFAEFTNWNESTVQNGWQKNSEITLYDTYSHALEAMDVNGHYAATVMTLDQTRVAATAANSQYGDIGYSGAEEQPRAGRYTSLNEMGNNIYTPVSNGATWTQQTAHTGTSSLWSISGQKAFVFSSVPQVNTYHVAVWSTRNDGKINYQLDGGTPQAANVKVSGSANGWYLLEADISNVSGYDDVSIWCEGAVGSTFFDDFRVHPKNAAMTGYVYNAWGELTHILNANNLYTKYEYDGMGRLVRTYQETFQNQYGNAGVAKVSETNYHYASPYYITLTASAQGPSGAIQPSGPVNVKQGAPYVFQLINNCIYPQLDYVLVDGQVIPIGVKTVLLDGTGVTVNQGAVYFDKVMSAHTVVANYYDQTGQGVAGCYMDNNGCRDGSYFYYYYNECGQPGFQYYVTSLSQVPADLRGQIPPEGCPASTGANCNQIN
jgi:YD repeat-containing protein